MEVFIYFKSVTSSYPWKSLVDFDKYSRFPLNVKEYILALGPIFFTGVLGIIVALIKKDQKLFVTAVDEDGLESEGSDLVIFEKN